MGKISLNELNIVKSIQPKEIKIDDKVITVIQYLPLEKKMNLIDNVIEQSGSSEKGFYHIVKLNTFYVIEMIRAYTNISFTPTQLKDPQKLYDIIVLNKIWDIVKIAIPEDERNNIWENICALAKEVTNYSRSVLGIAKALTEDYKNLDLTIDDMVQKLGDQQNFKQLYDIVTKLG